MEIIPGILEKDWIEIERKIELVRPFASTVHIDIIDGKFAPNTTFLDPEPFKKYTNPSTGSGLFFELHMMVENPISYLKPWASVGFSRFLGHVEHMPDQIEFIAQGQLLGEVGLALELKTSISEIKVPFEDLDNILFLAVNAGFSGQKFNSSVLSKIKEVAEKTFVPIVVDGGINDSNIAEAKNAGATACVATGFIFNGNPQAQFDKLTLAL
ncbi:MAG: hypothetical protein WD992_02285 [Candidatus Levyibacteriota bacterium]